MQQDPQLRAKFTECAQETLNPSAAQKVLENIERLETLDNIKALCESLAG
jgi:hypothetical protein